MPSKSSAQALIRAAQTLRQAVDKIKIPLPVTHTYNPLNYAWEPHKIYLERFGNTPKRVLFLGMNPGPFGMAQIGVPFGSIPAVRDWMKISAPISKPQHEHPKRPITGFDCPRVEVSGRRLWSELIAVRFPNPLDFFADQFVTNYCPLVFMTESGANFTPDKLRKSDRDAIEAACDEHLLNTLEILQPEWLVGIGKYAEKNLIRVATNLSYTPQIISIIHPAPASPLANREWPHNPLHHLTSLRIW